LLPFSSNRSRRGQHARTRSSQQASRVAHTKKVLRAQWDNADLPPSRVSERASERGLPRTDEMSSDGTEIPMSLMRVFLSNVKVTRPPGFFLPVVKETALFGCTCENE